MPKHTTKERAKNRARVNKPNTNSSTSKMRQMLKKNKK